MIQTEQYEKQTNSGGLEKLLPLKIDAYEVMPTSNIDVQGRLINGNWRKWILLTLFKIAFEKHISIFLIHKKKKKKKFYVIPHISSKSLPLKPCVGGIKFGLLSKFIGTLLMFK